MSLTRRASLIAALLAASALVTGCSTVSRLNPFDGGKKEAAEAVSEGERISIIAADDTVAPAEGLKGQDFFLPTPDSVASWPVPGGTPEQAAPHAQAGGDLGVAWRRDFGSASKRGVHVTAPPVGADGKIFVMDGEATVSAIDAQGGQVIWRRNLRPESRRDKEAFGGGVAYADGKLYVTSGYRFVAQLDAATGAVGWRKTTEQPIHGAPSVAGGKVLAVAIDNTLLTFESQTGDPSWTYQALSESARILAASSPAVAGDTVVAAFGSGELVALRLANGNDLWSETLSRANRSNALSEIRDIPGRPVVYQGDVFAVSHSGVFSATDLRTGAQRWSLPIAGITTPLPAGDVVYVVSRAGEVICVSRESGQVYWIRDLNAGKPTTRKRFFGLGGKVPVRPVWSSPLLASGRLLVADSGGDLAVLNAKTGEVERTLRLGSPVLLGPIAMNGTVYVATDDARLIALR